MRRFTSRLLPIDGRTDQANDLNVREDVTTGPAVEPIPQRPFAVIPTLIARSISTLTAGPHRERLDSPGVSSFRMLAHEVIFTSTNSHGSGGKADVAQAKLNRADWSDENLVAVKKLRSMNSKKARNEYIHEVEVMAGLLHENIVRLIGFVEDFDKGIAWIVLSWEPNGNLRDFIARGDWEIPERVSLIQDTFEGVQYIHTRQPPICHGDLKSLNILVSSSYRAVLTDFGSARAVTEPEGQAIDFESGQQTLQGSTTEQAYPLIHVGAAGNQLTLTGPAWSLRWAAPEVVKGKRPVLSSDIWAAGWVCWEVMTNKVPFPDLVSEQGITLTVIRGKVPSPHEHGQLSPIAALCNLMTDCWAFDPKARPNISRCCNELKWMPSEPPSSDDPSAPREPSAQLLLRKGQIEFGRASYEEAVSLFQQGLSLATSGGDRTWAAIALRLLGDTYSLQSLYSQAENSYNQAQEIFAQTGDDRNRALTMDSMGRLSLSRRECTQAEQIYTQAIDICARTGDEHSQAIALCGLGVVCRHQSKYTQGEKLLTQAREIYIRVGDDHGRANALRGLGDIYYAQSKYPQAEESYEEAKNIYTRLGHDLGRAAMLDELGKVYTYQSKFTQAEESVIESQKICVRFGQEYEQAEKLLTLGEIYNLQSKYSQAEDVYMQAQEIYVRLNEETRGGDALVRLASLYSRQSNYAQAEEMFARALEIYARMGGERSQAKTLLGMGNLYRNQSKYIQAEETYTRAQEIYVRLGDDHGRADTLTGLGEIYRHQPPKYAQAEESYTVGLEIYTRLGLASDRAKMLCGIGHLRRAQGRNGEAATLYVEARELCTQIGWIEGIKRVSSWLALVLPDQISSVTSPDTPVQPHISSTNLSG